MKCLNSECGEQLEPEWDACPFCGWDVSPSCPHCGTDVNAAWRFCPKCKGALVEGERRGPSATSNITHDPNASSPGHTDRTPPSGSPYLTEVAQPGTFGGSSGSRGWSGSSGITGSPVAGRAGPAVPDLEPGTVLEQYEIEEVLGRGGYGVVYRARHRTVGDAFAVKVMGGFGASEAFARALAGEYRAQKRIMDKRHILESEAPVATVHANVDWVLLPMEIAEKSLREWLEEVDRDEEGWLDEGLELLEQVCQGVQAIHEAGLVHLDLKPENVLLVREGKGKGAKWVAKVADFGLTRGLAELEQARPELFGDGVGTPAYMAPEQVLAAHWQDVGPAADVYGLGMLLYELLQGRLPYSGSAERIKAKKRDRELQIRRPGGPTRVVELAMRCLNPEEAARPASASEVARLLKEDPEERAAWEKARGADTEESYGTYRTPYPQGAWAGEATERQGVLRAKREAAERERAVKERRAREEARRAAVTALMAREFIRIQAGTFMMGSETGYGEQPVHRVRITKDFLLQKTPVTQRQWEAVMGRNPSHFERNPDHPVEVVNWDDAQEFIAKLNCLVPGGRFRLPTEAEWEYACRAGTTGDYGGTGRLDEMGWYDENAGDTTRPVAQKKPNAWGFYDMHGNVSEWCQDWYDSDYYARSPSDDPSGPPAGTGRVLRGGSWSYSAIKARSAYRNNVDPSYRNPYHGFRLARTL